MQNNMSSSNETRSAKTPPPKPQRSPSLNSPYAIAANRIQDFPTHPPNQRFSLTPQNMGMDVRGFATSQYSEQPQQSRSAGEVQGKIFAKPEFQQLPINSPSSSSVGGIKSESSGYATTDQSNYVSNSNSGRRTSAPLSPTSTPRFPLSGASFMAALSSTQQTMAMPPSHINTTTMSPPTTPTNDRQCRHPSHDDRSSLDEIPTAYYEQQVQKFRSGSDLFIGGTAKINGELNEVFVRRLRDIDENGQGDTNLKLITYQEWVDMLLKVNESMISNMEQLEADVAERLDFLQGRVNSNCRHSQGNDLMKCRKDIGTLMKFIQQSCRYDPIDAAGITLETLSPSQVFLFRDQELERINSDVGGGGVGGLSMGNSADPESMQRHKLYANIKALALEVADKHDEVRDLKRQVVCLEDEIQKATKKIQFKDDVIKELRNDLKRNAKTPSAESCMGMPPVNLDTPRSEASTLVSEGNQSGHYLDDVSSQFECLSHNEHLYQETLKTLNEEFNELCEANKQFSSKQMEKHRKRISDILMKSETEKAAAYRKLDFIRRQLIDLETSGVSALEGDNDSGFSSKNEHDQDAKILESVRKRLRNLNESNHELNNQVQKLQFENSELSTTLQSQNSFSERNSETLKSLADLLCSMTGNFSYTDMYKKANNQCEPNPFCKAIMDIKSSYQQREEKLLQTVSHKNRKIEELTQALIDHEKVFGQQQRQRMNLSEGEDIDNITPPSSLIGPLGIQRRASTAQQSLSTQPQPQQPQ